MDWKSRFKGALEGFPGTRGSSGEIFSTTWIGDTYKSM